MKINYLKLNNIGPYFGEHIFNLNTSSVNNVILIGGKNGAGKTTFLKAIKYGLFGCFSMGLKNETSIYFKEIGSFLNNRAKNNFYIEIGFEYVENFELNKYILKRAWNKVGGELNEVIKLNLNGTDLDTLGTKEAMDKLKSITNPNLINSYIFDGEKIGSIIEKGQTSQFLKETFNSIFNINLINQTQIDLQNYLAKKSEENNSKNQIECISLINKIKSLQGTIKTSEADLQVAESSKNNLLVIKKSNWQEFYRLGGLTKIEQQKLMTKISLKNKQNEETSKFIKLFLENDLALLMNVDLLDDGLAQVVCERQNIYPKILGEIELLLCKDLSDLKSEVKNSIVNCDSIHCLDNDATFKIQNKIQDLNIGLERVKEKLGSRDTNLDEYKIMKQKISNNENIDKLNLLIEENKKIDISIREIEEQIIELERKIESSKMELNITYQIFEKVNDEIKKDTLYDSSFVLGAQCLSLCEAYAKELTKFKLRKVSNRALKIFNDTIRKDDFISDIQITENFDLKLFNTDMEEINPKILSAGEMQILISSLIWAMFRISGRREMFIFDTPLARLDQENRLNFIEKIISTISHQVVILSTDSEFIGENLNAIENRVFKKYLLMYDDKNSSTSVLESYFGGDC